MPSLDPDQPRSDSSFVVIEETVYSEVGSRGDWAVKNLKVALVARGVGPKSGIGGRLRVLMSLIIILPRAAPCCIFVL